MSNRTFRDREILSAAQQRGPVSTLFAWFRLAGPGWLASAITLGGGSLGGALYLGMLGGTSMLWLQLVAIVIGAIMLASICYVTLSTGRRPYEAINEYVNPVLGVGWIAATILANMIWILPQFSLCYDALETSLMAEQLKNPADPIQTKMIVSGIIAAVALLIVVMSFRPGWMAKTFDLLLKLTVGVVVLCFVAVVYKLFSTGSIDWNNILRGFIPDFTQWNRPAPEIEAMLADMPGEQVTYWKDQLVKQQRSSMIGVTATAVGLNMTFLVPYAMIARKWDKPFRGLAQFDLWTGMAIPYILVTTCIVIAAANAFHAKADDAFLSNDPAEVRQSVLFNSALPILEKRYAEENGEESVAELDREINEIKARLSNIDPLLKEAGEIRAQLEEAQAAKSEKLSEFAASLSEAERRIAPSLIKPNSSQLALTLAPLFGAGEEGTKYAKLVFGIGAFAMGFSTIIILMLINAYAFAEIGGNYESGALRTLGAVAAVAVGFCWFYLWSDANSKTWLIIVASTFGAILLPIAYISFFALMNNRRLLGDEKPTGFRMTIWNVLMAIGVIGALVQAYGATRIRMEDAATGQYVVGAVVMFGILALIGFSARLRPGSRGYEE